MSEHPSAADLRGLFFGGVPEERLRAAILHLLRGCPECRAVAFEHAEAMAAPFPRDAQIPPEVDKAYDAAIRRAMQAARRYLEHEKKLPDRIEKARALLDEKDMDGFIRAPRWLYGLPFVEALLERSWAVRHDDPKKMVLYALFASLEADELDRKKLGEQRVEDIRCRAQVELANAHRAANNLREAEVALAESAETFQKGSKDDRLKARLLDVQASLYGDERSFDLCFQSLDLVIGLHRRLGDDHMVGRALISKGRYFGHKEEPDRAIELLTEGFALIDDKRDPQLALATVHNIVLALAKRGSYRKARRLLWENLWRYEEHGGEIDRMKVWGLRGLINTGLGNFKLAEQEYRKGKEGLEAAGLRYTAAIAALDLADVQLRQGKTKEAQSLAREAVDVFRSLKISRETETAVLFLEECVKQRLLSGAVLREIAEFLRRAEQDPGAKFEPKI